MAAPVMFLLNDLSVGGSELKTVRIANHLAGMAFRMHVGYLNSPETLAPMLESCVGRINLERCGKLSWTAVRRLEEYVRMHGIMRVIAVNLYPLLYATALQSVMSRARPSCAVTVNTTEFHSRKLAAQMLIYAPLLRRADRIAFGCRNQLDTWTERYGLPRERCVCIYNGVDADYYAPDETSVAQLRSTMGLPGADFVVGTVGKFRPEKRQQDLIESVVLLRSRGLAVSALLVGSGSEEVHLKAAAERAGIERFVRFAGQQSDVRPAVQAMDVFVLSSSTETFSNAALEAMAMGKPVVLSDVGGAREMVDEGLNGRLFPAGDVSRLADVLGEMESDRLRTARMGRAARQLVRDRFSFAGMVEEYRALCFDEA